MAEASQTTGPELTLKAGKCDADFSVTPPRIKPLPILGSLFLYPEDDLVHFCWKPRDAAWNDPELDLMMVPGDGSFQPYLGLERVVTEIGPKSPVNGRIFVLKFSSSSQRYLFWLQSKEQPKGDPAQFSSRDIKLGELVNKLLQGEKLDIGSEIRILRDQRSGSPPDDDTPMNDADGATDDADSAQRGSGTGGAGASATGGDIREEGEESREGGADGGRATLMQATDPSATAAIQNFLDSLKGGAGGDTSSSPDIAFPTLPELLKTADSIPAIDAADEAVIDDLLMNHIPPILLFMENEVEDIPEGQADSETIAATVMSMSSEQKRAIVHRVLRSPQFFQSLTSLTAALRDGGLPSISDALDIEVENKGRFHGAGGMPKGGGEAVRAFIEAFKKSIGKDAQLDERESKK